MKTVDKFSKRNGTCPMKKYGFVIWCIRTAFREDVSQRNMLLSARVLKTAHVQGRSMMAFI